jgi:hypothetical protein
MSLLFEKFSTLKHLTLHRVGTYWYLDSPLILTE